MSKLQNMRVIRIPAFRAVSSGPKTFEEIFGEGGYTQWVDDHRHLIRDLLYAPADFLWHEGPRETWGRGLNVLIHAIRDHVAEADTAPWPIIDFPGGLYLVATADENDPDDLNETVSCMLRWIEENPVFEYGDFPASGMCNMPDISGEADSLLGMAQQQIFLPLKRRQRQG